MKHYRVDKMLKSVCMEEPREGKDITIVPSDEAHFTVRLDIVVSDQFFGWILALGDGAKVLGPNGVVERMKEVVKKAYERYW